MTLTTIKVPAKLRDVLKAQAGSHGRTLGEHLQALADAQARKNRWAELSRAVADHPIDDDYVNEARDWQIDSWN